MALDTTKKITAVTYNGNNWNVGSGSGGQKTNAGTFTRLRSISGGTVSASANGVNTTSGGIS